MIPNTLRMAVAGLAVSLSGAAALAQWSTDPANNLRISDFTGDQNQPKIAPTPDGGAYVSWFDNGRSAHRNDTYTWSGAAYSRAAMSGPAARTRHAMAFDSVRHRTVLFGGEDTGAQVLGDTWEFSGTSWSVGAAGGPSARERFSMAFDAARAQVVLFGGVDGASALQGQTWIYNGTWSQLAPANAPSARKNTAMAYDPGRQVVVLFGGEDAGGAQADTWEWNGTDWTSVATASAPTARSGHAMAYEFSGSRVLLFGGADASATLKNDTWVFNGTNWTDLTPVTIPGSWPAPRMDVAMTNDFNAGGTRISFFGGFGFPAQQQPQPQNLGQTYEWSGTAWAQKTGISQPSARTGMAAAYDSVSTQAVLVGTALEGGYDVFMQRLSGGGFEQWAHNGLMISDRTVSSTVDYDMITDASGNAVIAYNDDVYVGTLGVQQISVSKISPAGDEIWRTMVTSGAPTKNNPHLTELSDGSYLVGWTNAVTPATITFQRFSAEGAPLLPPPGVTVSEATKPLNLSDLKPSGTGFIALWVRVNGTVGNPPRGLVTQKYDSSGVAQWASPITLVDSATQSISNGYFPTFLSDGAGGGVYGWYEGTTGARNAFMQHVLSNGTLKFASKKPSGPLPAGRIRVGAGLAYDQATGSYYLAFPETDSSTQSLNSVGVQKLDAVTGDPVWGDVAYVVPVPVAANAQPNFVQAQPAGGGCEVFFQNTTGPVTRVVESARVEADGSVAWHNLVNSDGSTDKARLATAVSTGGFVIAAYGWGTANGNDIAVARVNADGSQGTPACYANCDASTAAPTLNVADFTCFLQKYASADAYANCDASTSTPTLNVGDFTCFLQKYAAGCP